VHSEENSILIWSRLSSTGPQVLNRGWQTSAPGGGSIAQWPETAPEREGPECDLRR